MTWYELRKAIEGMPKELLDDPVFLEMVPGESYIEVRDTRTAEDGSESIFLVGKGEYA